MRKKGHSRTHLINLFFEGLGAGAYWFFDTFFIVTPFALSIILHSYLMVILALMSILIFYIVPQYILLKKLPAVLSSQGFSGYAKDVASVSFLKLLPNLCLIILTNSIGAWIATFKAIPYLLTGKLPVKYKTGA